MFNAVEEVVNYLEVNGTEPTLDGKKDGPKSGYKLLTLDRDGFDAEYINSVNSAYNYVKENGKSFKFGDTDWNYLETPEGTLVSFKSHVDSKFQIKGIETRKSVTRLYPAVPIDAIVQIEMSTKQRIEHRVERGSKGNNFYQSLIKSAMPNGVNA